LLFVAAGKRVAQVQDGRSIKGQVIRHQGAAAVRGVQGIIGVPAWLGKTLAVENFNLS